LLRKEASKRLAGGLLPQHWLPETESSSRSSFSTETLTSIISAFDTDELVQVRGISKDDKMAVLTASRQLAFEMSVLRGSDVSWVETKGHASIYYSPGSSISSTTSPIVLRSSYKEGAWTKRPKAPRDSRGQIIKEQQ
jgi:hypothetical protein